jgi:DNA-binding CsgD family transcriptional regulator
MFLWMLVGHLGALTIVQCYAQNNATEYLNQGWKALIVDDEITALNNFSLAYETAQQSNDVPHMAEALLNLGICSYGASYNNGMKYAIQAWEMFNQLKTTQPAYAMAGQSRCLQLMSTIYGRQGKYNESILLSRAALKGLNPQLDSNGTCGLIYSSLGNAYVKLGKPDSAVYYHSLALAQYLQNRQTTYLPVAYIRMGNMEQNQGNKNASLGYYERALKIADSIGNQQARVSSLIALGEWQYVFEKNTSRAQGHYEEAQKIAARLSDKYFTLLCLQHLADLKTHEQAYEQALRYTGEMMHIKDSVNTTEKEKMLENLEIQFKILDQQKELELVKKDKRFFKLTSYLLWGGIGLLIAIAMVIILFLKRINKRDQQLLQKKEELQQAFIQQQMLKDEQMRNEIDFKESQLSALTLQMLQKSELMKELKEKLEANQPGNPHNELSRIINKGFNQDKEWDDFNVYFESINRNFYTKLRELFPDVSANDLKICALIKLNLSSKEMAGILNISPDSVKTARYRLRKKLQLNTEDNLTEFIQQLS